MKITWEMKSLAGNLCASVLVLSMVSCAGDDADSAAGAKSEPAKTEVAAAATEAAGDTKAAETEAATEMVSEAKAATTEAKPEAEEKTGASAVRSGEAVYKSVCMACHVAEGRPTVGPPIFAVKNHVIGAHPERDDFVNRVVAWVKAPDEKNALMPGAVRNFGLMPAFPLPDEELKAVAEFIYDSDMSLPDWYKEHYQAEHGEMPKESSAPARAE